MGHQQLYWSHPRKYGQGSRSCRVCSNRHGLIRKYGLNMCRQCFRQYAKDIGFVKASVHAFFLQTINTLLQINAFYDEFRSSGIIRHHESFTSDDFRHEAQMLDLQS
ncbi:40S ribosomal protein S29 [Pseudorasbora parva]|uniref:40S ribosomal protein S29 n=1 Tax=Pseudorasbora parva TaxID=51549 RepID=UPI00351F7094